MKVGCQRARPRSIRGRRRGSAEVDQVLVAVVLQQLGEAVIGAIADRAQLLETGLGSQGYVLSRLTGGSTNVLQRANSAAPPIERAGYQNQEDATCDPN